MTRFVSTTAPAIRAVVLTTTVTLAGSAWSGAYAQTSDAPVLVAERSNSVLPAPVGHRQPRRADIPDAVQRDENAGFPSAHEFEQQPQICRNC